MCHMILNVFKSFLLYIQQLAMHIHHFLQRYFGYTHIA